MKTSATAVLLTILLIGAPSAHAQSDECCCLNGACEQLDLNTCQEQGGTPILVFVPPCDCELMEDIDACDPPFIVHRNHGGNNPVIEDDEIPEETEPHSGYIDPRSESSNGTTQTEGVTRATLVFSQAVNGDAFGSPVTADNFFVTQTGSDEPPVVTEVKSLNSKAFLLILDRPFKLAEWTTIRAVVYSSVGVAIPNFGDLGPLALEPDRIDIGFLPGDIDQSGRVEALDILRFRQGFTGQWSPALGNDELYLDIDRNGTLQPLDLLRLRQIMFGTGTATQAWMGAEMNALQP